jgi:hypothetical protein
LTFPSPAARLLQSQAHDNTQLTNRETNMETNMQTDTETSTETNMSNATQPASQPPPVDEVAGLLARIIDNSHPEIFHLPDGTNQTLAMSYDHHHNPGRIEVTVWGEGKPGEDVPLGSYELVVVPDPAPGE